MEEAANSTTMVKDDLVTMMRSIVLEESAVVKKEQNLNNLQTENVADETILLSYENMKEEKAIQDGAQPALPEIRAVIKEESILEESQCEEEMMEQPMFESCENMKEEKVVQDEAHVMPEIQAVIKEELMAEEEIMEQHTSSTTGTLVIKEVIIQGNICRIKSASKVHNSGLSEATTCARLVRLCECDTCNKLYFESKFPLSHQKLINKRKQKSNMFIKHTLKNKRLEEIFWCYGKHFIQNSRGDRTAM